MSRFTFRRAAAVVMAASLVAGGPIATAAHAAPPSLNIVAVGDSYASGQGAKGSAWLNAACERSALAAPQQASAQLNALESTTFVSQACSGAIIEDPSGQTDPAHRLLGPSGQLSQVGVPGERVDGLTVSIGGNDIGFAGIVQNCMIPLNDCGTDPSVLAPLALNLAALPGKLADVVNAVQGPGRVVPGSVANVFVTEYPDPTTSLNGTRCGNFWAPGFEGFDGITESEALWASQQVVAPLNRLLLAAVNAANGAPGAHPAWHFVTGIASAFATHGYCTGSPSPSLNLATLLNPRWINTPVDSLVEQGDVYGSMHPNADGQAVVAGILSQSMKVLIPPPVLKSVPNVVGNTSAGAAALMRAAGFGVGIASVVDQTCNNIGMVTSQLPRGGSMAPQGSSVTIWVAVRPKTPCP